MNQQVNARFLLGCEPPHRFDAMRITSPATIVADGASRNMRCFASGGGRQVEHALIPARRQADAPATRGFILQIDEPLVAQVSDDMGRAMTRHESGAIWDGLTQHQRLAGLALVRLRLRHAKLWRSSRTAVGAA